MPHVAPLHADDPRRVGRYRLTGRVAEMPAEGPVYLAATANQQRGDPHAAGRRLDPKRCREGPLHRRGDGLLAGSPRSARRGLSMPASTTAWLTWSASTSPGRRCPSSWPARGHCAASSLAALAVGTATGLAAIHQAGLVHGQFGPEHVVLGASGPRVVGFGITPPYGAATPSADMLAWGRTVLFAATGRPDAGERDLAALAEPLRGLVGQLHQPGPGRPAARPVGGARAARRRRAAADPLAEGSRLAVRAALPAASGPGQAGRRTPRPAGPGRSGGWPGSRPACWPSRWPCTCCRIRAPGRPARTGGRR